jgi:PAS domain S-box-containing protein
MENKKILIVEDETITAMEIQENLIDLGYSVPAIATSGNDALEKAEKVKPDLILMDILIEGPIDGVEVARLIHERFDIPVIYVSAYSDENTLQRAKITEPYGYILKPIEEKDLHTVIEIALYKHEMEKKLKENERWFATTLKSIGDAVITTNKKEEIIFMNSIAESVTGWKQEDAFGKKLNKVYKIVDEKTHNSIESPSARVMREENVVDDPKHKILISKDGKEISVDDNAAPIIDDNKNLAGVVLVFRDITERMRVEQIQRESEERFRSVVENSHTGIAIINDDYKLIYVNDELIHIQGYSKKEIIGQDIRNFVNQKSKELITDLNKRRQKGEDVPNRYELNIIRKDEEKRDVEIISSIIKDLHGNIQTVIQVLDITEQKKLEEQLRQAQKMKAIGTLAGGVAHDFNNLLTAILGCVNMVMLKIKKKDSIYRDLKDIQISAERAAELTHQLLLFSRNQPMKYISLNLNKTIENLLMMLYRLIGEDIEINTSFDSNLWTVRVDKGTMEQVIMNIVVNSRDAMPSGGKLTIQTKNLLLDDKYCEVIPDAKPGKFVCLSISDTGIGMGKETLQRIFEPFFSTKGPGKGTGLGLSVVYGIIKQQGGWIDVNSEEAKGTSFKIFLPAFLEKPDKEKYKKTSLSQLKGNGEWILVVEDETKVREFVERALVKNGYNVVTAADSIEALDLFYKKEKEFKLVFSDVVLYNKSGIELADELVISKPDIKILLSSGYTDQKSQWPIIQKKAYRFLQKPYSINNLLISIKELLSMPN